MHSFKMYSIWPHTYTHTSTMQSRECGAHSGSAQSHSHSGVGAVAAVVALAATLFSPKVNIHNVLQVSNLFIAAVLYAVVCVHFHLK